MTQEQKHTLFVALCGYLPYGCVYQVARPAFPSMELRVSNEKLRRIEVTIDGDYGVGCNSATLTSISIIKPYLRPLSSMTEEEGVEYCDLQDKFLLSSQYPVTDGYALFDWLNAHHFDYRGLIKKGLAIEVTKDNNPYKD